MARILLHNLLYSLGEDDRQAFGSFALIDRYLGAGRAPGWLHHAPNALRVIEQLQQAEMPKEAEKQAALEILSTLLTQISTEPTLESAVRDSHNSRTE